MAGPDAGRIDDDGGRGTVLLAGARAYHVLAGYGLAIALPRLLGTPEEFGLYSKVMVGVQILNNVLVAATILSVSKFVGDDPQSSPNTFRRLLFLNVFIGALLAGALLVAAPAFARFHRDVALTPLLRAVAIVPFCYAAYAAAAGYLNGRERFGRQAALDVLFHTLRVAGALAGAALLGWGALGPISGVAAAAALVAMGSLLVVGIGAGGGKAAYRAWLAFLAPLWIYHVLVNAMLELDVQVLGKTISDLAVASGLPEQSAVATANRHVGFYHAAQKFAFVPYQLAVAIAFVVFPLVSRATRAGSDSDARRTIRGVMRASLLVLLSVAAPLAGAAGGVMRLAYPEEYLAGAPALEVLSLGIVACSLFVIAGTILSSAGRAPAAALAALAGLVVAVGATTTFVRRAGIGEDTLTAAAFGSSLGMGVAFLLAAGLVHARFGALLPPVVLLRGAAAAAAAFGAARAVPHDTRPAALAALAAGFATYLLVLIAVREIGLNELGALRRMLSRRPMGAGD